MWKIFLGVHMTNHPDGFSETTHRGLIEYNNPALGLQQATTREIHAELREFSSKFFQEPGEIMYS